MMSGMPLETCWAFNKRWDNKFYYKVASCWLFLLILYRVLQELEDSNSDAYQSKKQEYSTGDGGGI